MLNLSNKWFIWSKQSKLKDRYQIEERKSLGQNKFGQVFLFTEKSQENNLQKVVRVIPKQKIINTQRFKQQVNQLRHLNHKNIVKLFELFEDEKNLYFIMEFCQGGFLYEKILLRYKLQTSVARSIFAQIIDSLNAAHRASICHRDLRPESIHFINKEIDNFDLKLIDLGFQLIYVEDYLRKNNNTIVETSRQGKLYYTAPEIFNGKLSEKSEIWSAGVILHVLLTGELPFSGQDEKEIYENIQNFKIDLKVEGLAGDLVKKILQPEQQRIQIFQIQKHEWMTRVFNAEEEILNINFKKLKQLTQNNFLQKIMRGIVSDQVKNGIEEKLGKIFETYDHNGSGLLTIEQLQKALENQQDCDDILKLLKYIQTEDGNINYLDFLNQIMEKRVFVDEERIYKTFKMFDIHNKNKISNGDLWEILHKLENFKNITKDYCSLLISEVDRDNDGEIEYLEFIDMFFKRA